MRGTVFSLSSPKTAVVKVVRVFHHPRLSKTIKRHRKFSCQVESFLKLRPGQAVEICQTSPKSSRKRWLVYKAYG